MAVVFGYEIADNWHSYISGTGNSTETITKWWRCPRCKHDFRFNFTIFPYPPLSLPCPTCGRESPIPWPAAPMVVWTCQRCGHTQKAYGLYEWTEVWWEGFGTKTWQREIGCNKCGKLASKKRGLLDDICNVFNVGIDSGIDMYEHFANAMSHLVGSQGDLDIMTARQREYREQTERAERTFDNFLRKVPQISAEQARLVEEEKRRIALEAQKREEELRLIKKEASTAVGLKRMKPTNFELAVGSLYLKRGYKVYVTPTSGDQGIDLVAIKDKERIAVQCKRYRKTVPVSQVRDFYGSFVGTFSRGVFITSSAFSQSTLGWAEERQGLDLIDGEQLAKLFVEHEPKIVRNFEKWK